MTASFPLCRQHDAMQCGVACLQMICKYYGKDYSLDFLAKYCFATNEGVSLLGISEAANRLGLQTVCYQTDMTRLCKIPCPCILYWNQNHFVVLYNVKSEKKFYIADPAKGLICYTKEELNQH